MRKKSAVVALAAALSLSSLSVAATAGIAAPPPGGPGNPGFPGMPGMPGQPGKPSQPDYPDSEFYITATDANWDSILEKSKKQTVIAEFGAAWCHYCKVLKPVLKKYNDEDKSWIFAYVDVDKTKLGAKYQINNGVPVTLAIKNGVQVGLLDGWEDDKTTREFINKYK